MKFKLNSASRMEHQLNLMKVMYFLFIYTATSTSRWSSVYYKLSEGLTSYEDNEILLLNKMITMIVCEILAQLFSSAIVRDMRS